MDTTFKVYISDRYDSYVNLAAESALYERGDSAIYLYLWKNERTVVIGKHQNPFTECNINALIKDGGTLMRRPTGGGAVYHDAGNLNFSFIVPSALYDVKKQLGIIVGALRSFGINACVSGRNDLTVNGKKFSGNAYLLGHTIKLHHGTLLIKTDGDALNKYLITATGKTARRGVKSVSSKVVNLTELCPELTADTLSNALIYEAERAYNANALLCDFSSLASSEQVKELARAYRSEEYLYGNWRHFKGGLCGTFDWGFVELDVANCGENARISAISTDGLYPNAVSAAIAYVNDLTPLPVRLTADESAAAQDIINLYRSNICTT